MPWGLLDARFKYVLLCFEASSEIAKIQPVDGEIDRLINRLINR